MAWFFLHVFFVWRGRCQVILVVTPVSTCTQNKSKGNTQLCLLCSDWFISPFMFLLIYRFGSQLSTLLCFVWICCPFCSFFLLDYIYGSHWMLVYRDCQASHWKIEPLSKWLEGDHYTHIIYHNIIIISWRILSIWCFHAGFELEVKIVLVCPALLTN